MNPINIDLVRNKDGNAIVNWSGVLAFSLIVAMVSMVGAAAFMLAVGWFSLAGLITPVALNIGIVVGSGVRRGLQTPVDQLPRVS